MSLSQDKLNCLKNLMQLMCCDGSIDDEEKKFLGAAAKQLDVQIADWNQFLRDTLKDNIDLYPIEDTECAIATLKALVVMAKADTYVDDAEKQMIRNFAKAIGVTNEQWNQIMQDIDVDTLFAPFQKELGKVVALKDDFEKIDAFLKVTGDHGVGTQVTEFNTFLNETDKFANHIVCFHAAPDTEASLQRCRRLVEKTGGNAVAILTRFQGLQVKYMHEIGLKKCIIEPVYSQDIMAMFSSK